MYVSTLAVCWPKHWQGTQLAQPRMCGWKVAGWNYPLELPSILSFSVLIGGDSYIFSSHTHTYHTHTYHTHTHTHAHAHAHSHTHTRTHTHTHTQHTHTHTQYTHRDAPPAFQPRAVTTHCPLQAKKKPTDNISKEMKTRLRDEYVGFGGTPNKVCEGIGMEWHKGECSQQGE